MKFKDLSVGDKFIFRNNSWEKLDHDTAVADGYTASDYINPEQEVFPQMILYVLDVWHGKEKEKLVYSDDPAFQGKLEAFLEWVLQHQEDLSGVKRKE